VDTAKIHRLGWKPKHDFQMGLKKTVEWYAGNESWWHNIKQKQAEYKAWIEKQYGTS